MQTDDAWHVLEITTERLSPTSGSRLQLPLNCTWCGAPGRHSHVARVEGPGLLPGMRDIVLEVMLCPDCYRRQRMIEIGGWSIMVAAMVLYVARSAFFQGASGAIDALFLVLLLGAFLLASWRWRVARLRRGFRLKPSASGGLLLSVRSAAWLEEFTCNSSANQTDPHPSSTGE